MSGVPVRVLAATLIAGLALPATSQEARQTEMGAIAPVSGFTGEMSMTMESTVPDDVRVTETIKFEPWQMLDELFRSDLVFLMRAGPSNWNASDRPDTKPMACDSQRLLSERGKDQMRQLGALLLANDLRPGEIKTSQWCRAQESYVAMERGLLETDMEALDGLQVAPNPDLDLLAAENGAQDVDGLRDIIAEWDGAENDGPLLLITHFPNILELTRFRVYEGEILILDPKRDNRVLGYLRLTSAAPDANRFDPSVLILHAESVGENTPD